MKTKCIMVQGTMSDAGKSVVCAALCRMFRQDGYRVAPFKSQNMALNSYITEDGLEMGRAQVMQAEAAGVCPDVRMNPVLLKPSSDTGSQIIVMGEVLGQMSAAQYHGFKKKLMPRVRQAYEELAAEHDIIVIEGAGSPAEINLMDSDIVNMGLAAELDAPVILVGDIDRGGVFAQLYGTVALLPLQDQRRIRGMIINKFRGDPGILRPGLMMLEEKTQIPMLGVIPMLDVDLDDEDSLSSRLRKKTADGPIDIAVIRFPRLSNFTDFNALQMEGLSGVRYVRQARELGKPDLIILPGTKNTMEDLKWLRQSGLESGILKHAAAGGMVLGVCGGYQMLGEHLRNPEGTEGDIPYLHGLGLLPVDTTFTSQKTRTRVQAVVQAEPFRGVHLDGYEIHMGVTEVRGEPFCRLQEWQQQPAPGSEKMQDDLSKGRSEGPLGASAKSPPDNAQNDIPPASAKSAPEGTQAGISNASAKKTLEGCRQGRVYGTYLHGLFDTGELAQQLIGHLARQKGIDAGACQVVPREIYVQQQYDHLARAVRAALDMDRIYEIVGV